LVVDDDWKYRANLLEELLRKHREVGGVVVDRGKQMSLTSPYNTWKMGMFDQRYPHRTLTLSGSGMLVPLVHLQESIMDMETAQRLASGEDDFWWTINFVISGITVTEFSHQNRHPHTTHIYSHSRNLWTAKNKPMGDASHTANDIAFRKLLDYARNVKNVDLKRRIGKKAPVGRPTSLAVSK
jgi:hypothetical protein